jgi:hypothetical protein
MSATPERRRRRIESRKDVTVEGGTPEGRERLREARERVRGQRERQARELRQEVAQRARDEGLNVSEDDVRVREEEGEVVAEVREEAIERQQERAEQEAREQAEEQALEAAEEQGLDVSREDIEVQKEKNGEFVARVEGDSAAEQEEGLTAETPTGRAVERAQDVVTEPLSTFTGAISAAVRGEREQAGEAAQSLTLPSLRAESPEAMAERLRLPEQQEFDQAVPGEVQQVSAGAVEGVGEIAQAPELGIRIAEDAQAIAEPAFRAGAPTGIGERALPTEAEFTTARTEAEAVPGQVGTVAARTAEFATERPLRFGGQIASGALLSAGATGAASRAGVIPESVQRLPTTGEVAGEGVRRGARFTTEAGRRAVERAAPIVRRELEATPIDVERFEPLTTQREMVGAVFPQPEGGTRIREMRRAGIDAPEEATAEPDITVPAGEPGPFGRVREPQIQRTLTGEEIPAERARGFREETRTFEGEEATLAERADVGGRAQVGEADFGAGEQVVVEAARGQTALPEVVIDVVEPGVARRVLGEEPRVEVRGEPGTEAMQAATGEVLGDIQERFGEILRQGERGRTVDEIELGEVPASETTPVIEEGRISADVEQFTSEIEGDRPASDVFAEEARRRAEESAEELPFDVDQVLFRSEIRRPRGEIETFEQTPEREALFTSPEFTELGFFTQQLEGVGDILPSGLTGALRGDINLPTSVSRRRRQVLAIEPESIRALEVESEADLAEALQEADPGTAFTTERGFTREMEALLPPGTTLERVPGGEFRVETEQFGEVPGQLFRAVGEERTTRAETRARGERAEVTLLGGEGRQLGEVETVTPEEAAREAIEQTEPRFIDPETPTERTRTDFDTDDGAPGGFRFDFGALGVSPVVEPDAPATGLLASIEAEATAVEPATFQAPDLDITPAQFTGPDVTDITDVAPAVDTQQELATPALAFGAPTGGRGEVERAVPRTPTGFVPDEDEEPEERRPTTIFGEERVKFELPTVGELI